MAHFGSLWETCMARTSPHRRTQLWAASWVVAGLTTLGCGPKTVTPTTPEPAANEATAAPPTALMPDDAPPASPLTLAGVPIPGAPELPMLSGATRNLDLVTLTTSTQTFTIEADTEMFTATDPRVGRRLQLAFEFDPRWRVGLWDAHPVAWTRQADAAGWSAPWGGYRRVDQYTIRAMFRLVPRPDDHAWSASGLVARNNAGTRAMQVMSWQVDRGAWAGQQAAAFTIDGQGLSLEVHEIAPNLTLTGTQAALRLAALRTKAIADQIERDHLQRTSLAMVPTGEPRIGNPFANLTVGAGQLDIRGRINPGAPGWTWVRILGPGQTSWNATAVALATAERVGWDTNPSVVSYFQSTVPFDTPPPETGRVEVWFHPDGSDTVQKLASFPFPTP